MAAVPDAATSRVPLRRAGTAVLVCAIGALTALDLVAGAWSRRADLRLMDALYVELATRLRVPVLTTDPRARASAAAEGISVHDR